MTRDEIVTALRCCTAIYAMCNDCPCHHKNGCEDLAKSAAAYLIENQQRHIEALMKANAGLRDTVLRRDGQIEKLVEDRKELLNELCQYCGEYERAHEGACDGCKWREM